MEQRINLKFLVKLGKKPAECLQLLREVYRGEAMSQARVYEWHKRFKDGRESVDDDAKSGRPTIARTDENVARVREMIRNDRRLTIRMIAEELSMAKESVRTILTHDLNMRKVCAKVVPRLLNDDQKQQRLDTAQEILQHLEEDATFLDNVVTGDESWVFQFDPETKRQSLEWRTPGSPRPVKARRSRSQVKTMLIAFFDSRGLIHHEFVPQGQTVNQHFYREVLDRLIQRMRRVRREQWENKEWLLHHDNAPVHTAISVKRFLAEKQVPQLSQPPYSPDMAPCDFWLFPRLKEVLKGSRFEDIEDIQRNVTKVLRSIPNEEFRRCTRSWAQRLKTCVECNGDYFEGCR